MEQIGPYKILNEIARGGAGVVYRGRHESLQREVAIKVLLAGQGASEVQRRRFLREAKAISRLEHPGIVQVFSVGEHEDGAYMVLAYVDGVSLQEAIDRAGQLSVERATEIAVKVAVALDNAHAAGILHRDLKPANVLLDLDGEPRLTDFGLAKDLSSPSPSPSLSLSVTGGFMGTPGYWPPEQARGELEALGPRSDVYGLGATLYAMLTGQPPHGEPESLVEALEAVGREPPPPSSLNPAVDPQLDRVVLRCLAADPAGRFASMSELVQALGGGQSAGGGRKRIALGLATAGALLGALLLASQAATPAAEPAEVPTQRPEAPPSEPVPVGADERSAVALAEGEELFQAGDLRGALKAFDEAIRLDPTNAEAYGNRGATKGELGDVPGEIEDCSEAIRLDPIHVHAYRNRALGREALGDLLGALEDISHAIELSPGYAEAYETRAQIHVARGDAQAAVEDYTTVIQLQPRSASAYGNRGVVRGRLGDRAGEIEDYTSALAIDPDYAPGYYNRGLQKMYERDTAGALEDYSEAIRCDPGYLQAIFSRATLRAKTGDRLGAIEDFERGLQLEPSGEWEIAARRNLEILRRGD